MIRTETRKARFDQSVFCGLTAIKDFLHPERHPPIPLVELPEHLNPFQKEGVRVFAKLMYLLPLLNVKSLPALNLLLAAQAAGRLEGVHTLVEASSGNTAFSLTIFAKIFGIGTVRAIIPRDIAPGKLELLRLSGTDVSFSNESDGPGGISLARDMGRQKGLLNLAQYEAEANPAAHEKWTAKQIWEQLDGQLTVFCAGIGTSGTVVGATRFFRMMPTKVTIVGVNCAPAQAVPGVRTVGRMNEISFDWRDSVDFHVEIETKDSFRKSLSLCRTGLLAGPSSGFALAGLQRFLSAMRESGQLDEFRNRDGEVIAVFICADTALIYLDKYSTHLDPEDF